MVRDNMMSPWPDDEAGETWKTMAPATDRGGEEFTSLHRAERLVLDRIAAASMPPEVTARITAGLTELADLLAEYQAPEIDRWDGWRPDLPGRGHALLPPYVIDDEDETTIRARVTFTRFFLGGNGAAHGGAQPLLFDDLLGRVANHHQPGVARTAFLKLNYRRVTPINVELTAEVTLDRVEGRKRWCSGRLINPAGEVVADVEALFLQLLPGQQ